MTETPDERPGWLRNILDQAEDIQGADLSRFLPPVDSGARPGAVLMLFGEGPHGPDLLFTERAHDMRSHPGQISFPGGKVEGNESSREAALREAEEEVGLDPTGVDVLLELPELWLPPSNFAVTPVVGWWREECAVGVVDRAEVQSVFRAPIEELLDPEYRVTVTHPSGYSSPGFLVGPEHDLILWGFTAGLVNKLFEHVRLNQPWDESRTRTLPSYMVRDRG